MDKLFRNLGITNVPAFWQTCRDDFRRWKSEGGCGELNWKMPDDAPLVFGLPDGVLGDLKDVFSRIKGDSGLKELAGLWHFIIYHLPEKLTDSPNAWPLPTEHLGQLAPLFPLAVLVSGTDHSLDAFNKKGVSRDIAVTTLSYSGYFVRDYHRKHGIWGLDELSWLTNFIHARLFQLGRLSFKVATYDWTFRAYRHRATAKIITLCEDIGRYRTDGLADGTNGLFDQNAWTSRLDINKDAVTGCPVTEYGKAVREPVTLDLCDWEQVLAPGDRMVEVHIPAENGKLTPEVCREAYRSALDLIPQLYPDVSFSAFTCWSWLLDPGLSRMLPPDSNIVSFQRAFHPLPVAGDHRQAYDLVFGSSEVDPITAPKTTYLQQAIADYVASGQMMRSSAGFMMWDEVEGLVDASC